MLLAIETGYGACSVALLDDGAVAGSRHELIGRGHAERLLPLIEELLCEAGAVPTAIAVDVGPGSFTGLRVGIAAARALALVWQIPVTGFASTALVAAAVFARDPALSAVSAVMDAGRGEVYLETFGRGLASMGPAVAIVPIEAANRAASAIAGNAAGALAAAGCTATIVGDGQPDAADVRLLPAWLLALPPTPIYVRAPDAKLPLA